MPTIGSIPALENLRITLVVEPDRDGLPKRTKIASMFAGLELAISRPKCR